MISQPNENIRRIVLSGSVREEMASQFIEQVTALECYDVTKPISIYIDTYGGSVDSALTIYDTIKSCCCPIVTVGIGKVMSAGVLLLAAGDRGFRYITKNTRVMVHEISGGVVGSITEMETTFNETRRLQDVYIEILASETGVGVDKIRRDMKAETYMTADEAVKYGIVDKVVPYRKPKEVKVEKKTNKK